MPIERINPEGLRSRAGSTPVVRATGGATVYIAGQVPVDRDGNLVAAGDFGAQATQVFANLGVALAAVGAHFSHVVKMTTYIVGYHHSLRAALEAVRTTAMGGVLPASTIVGVQALAIFDYLLEIEAIAVVG